MSGRHTAILLFGGSEGGLVYPYRLHRHGRNDVTALTYPTAGHMIALVLPLPPLLKPNFVPGGSPRADAAARANAWSKLLHFLRAIRG